MNLELIVCIGIGLVIFTVSVSNSLDVKCANKQYSTVTCMIKETIEIQSSDYLNIEDVANPSEVRKVVISAENEDYRSNESKTVSFPSRIFQQFPFVMRVEIENVGMESLVMESLQNASSLRSLHLANNKIKMIPANVTALASKLKWLYLSGNEISEIEDYAFHSSSLHELNLSGNKLTSIGKNVFFNATKFKIILLFDNFIEHIEEGAFDLPELEIIYLDRNNLTNLPDNLFAYTPKLYKLSIRANQLSTEIVHALDKARGLTELHLEDNPTLSGVNLLSLKQLPKLEYLDLSNTSLTYNTILNLPDFATLEVLEINTNNLTDSNLLHLLGGIKSLRSLQIESNNLTKLEDFNDILSMLPSLREIYLDDNQWECAWIESARKTCKFEAASDADDGIYCLGISLNCE